MYMASPWTFAVHELSTKATTHSGAALTSKGSERRAMPDQCQNTPATICICSGTVLGCHEAVVRTLPSVSPEVTEETFFLFSSGEWEAGCDVSFPLDMPGVKRQPCGVRDVSQASTENTASVPNCECSLLSWACSPAGFGVQLSGGLSDDFDGSPSSEAQLPPGGHSSILVG